MRHGLPERHCVFSTLHNIQINMFCLHTTGERTMEEIKWCLSLHVELLNSPYVHANKSKTNGSLSRDM